ncbi:hypothetical protein OSB04_016584 [Centaurea solstitialis]|uniref:RWP-RK domain-containing protein n=1 Tax=Centaurea solstitialis TaxID=347529 RepID=A0AA38T187_9ASTR|nr:hypothetical protein OSB04_016584 [Centaurea solstitialis]
MNICDADFDFDMDDLCSSDWCDIFTDHSNPMDHHHLHVNTNELQVTNSGGKKPPKRPGPLSLEEIQKHFEKPIRMAAKELNVGLTLLKKRCRELNIKGWPHRKLKSLKSIIQNVKEMGLQEEMEKIEFEIKANTNEEIEMKTEANIRKEIDEERRNRNSGISRLGIGDTHSLVVQIANLSSTMSQETDPSEHPSQGSSEHHSGAPRSLTAIQEHDTSSDSDADSHRAPIRSATGPTLWTRDPVWPQGDGAGPSWVRGQGGSSSSSSSSSSSRSSSRTRTPPPIARPPPAVHAPIVHLGGMTPVERHEVARIARGQRIHESLIDHHDHMIDSLIDVAGADSQQLTRVVALLSHTMASLHHLYTVVYMVMALVVIMFGWAIWRARIMPPRREDPELARLVSEQVLASLPNIVS